MKKELQSRIVLNYGVDFFPDGVTLISIENLLKSFKDKNILSRYFIGYDDWLKSKSEKKLYLMTPENIICVTDFRILDNNNSIILYKSVFLVGEEQNSLTKNSGYQKVRNCVAWKKSNFFVGRDIRKPLKKNTYIIVDKDVYNLKTGKELCSKYVFVDKWVSLLLLCCTTPTFNEIQYPSCKFFSI